MPQPRSREGEAPASFRKERLAPPNERKVRNPSIHPSGDVRRLKLDHEGGSTRPDAKDHSWSLWLPAPLPCMESDSAMSRRRLSREAGVAPPRQVSRSR